MNNRIIKWFIDKINASKEEKKLLPELVTQQMSLLLDDHQPISSSHVAIFNRHRKEVFALATLHFEEKYKLEEKLEHINNIIQGSNNLGKLLNVPRNKLSFKLSQKKYEGKKVTNSILKWVNFRQEISRANPFLNDVISLYKTKGVLSCHQFLIELCDGFRENKHYTTYYFLLLNILKELHSRKDKPEEFAIGKINEFFADPSWLKQLKANDPFLQMIGVFISCFPQLLGLFNNDLQKLISYKVYMPPLCSNELHKLIIAGQFKPENFFQERNVIYAKYLTEGEVSQIIDLALANVDIALLEKLVPYLSANHCELIGLSLFSFYFNYAKDPYYNNFYHFDLQQLHLLSLLFVYLDPGRQNLIAWEIINNCTKNAKFCDCYLFYTLVNIFPHLSNSLWQEAHLCFEKVLIHFLLSDDIFFTKIKALPRVLQSKVALNIINECFDHHITIDDSFEKVKMLAPFIDKKSLNNFFETKVKRGVTPLIKILLAAQSLTQLKDCDFGELLDYLLLNAQDNHEFFDQTYYLTILPSLSISKNKHPQFVVLLLKGFSHSHEYIKESAYKGLIAYCPSWIEYDFDGLIETLLKLREDCINPKEMDLLAKVLLVVSQIIYSPQFDRAELATDKLSNLLKLVSSSTIANASVNADYVAIAFSGLLTMSTGDETIRDSLLTELTDNQRAMLPTAILGLSSDTLMRLDSRLITSLFLNLEKINKQFDKFFRSRQILICKAYQKIFLFLNTDDQSKILSWLVDKLDHNRLKQEIQKIILELISELKEEMKSYLVYGLLGSKIASGLKNKTISHEDSSLQLALQISLERNAPFELDKVFHFDTNVSQIVRGYMGI